MRYLRMENRKYLCVVFFLIAAIFVKSIPVKAEVQTGSITVQLQEIETDRKGVEISCYQVAEMDQQKEGSFIFLPAFQETEIQIDQLNTNEECMKAAQSFASCSKKETALTEKKKTDTDGKVSFENLVPGVYLIEQTDQAKYGSVAPFLVILPDYNDEQQLQYKILATPKGTPLKEEKKEKEKESGKQLVKTGDESKIGWAVAGLLMGSAGMIAGRRKKKS